MKKILKVLVCLMIVLLTSVPVNAIYHSDVSGISMTLPSDFYEVEGALNGATAYVDYYGNQVKFMRSVNTTKTSFTDLPESELKKAATELREVFITDGSDYAFITLPEAENVTVNGYKGVKIEATYSHEDIFETIYSTVYYFSTESNICGVSFISTLHSTDSWYAEYLKTMYISGEIYEEEKKLFSSDNENSLTYNIGYNIGKSLPVVLIVCGIAYLIGKLTNKKAKGKG